MVQLPATAAIEYVAACCRTRTRTKTVTKAKIGTITKTVLGAYARPPQVQCIYAQSRLSVPSILEWRTNIQKKRNSAPYLRGELTPALQIFRVCRGGCTGKRTFPPRHFPLGHFPPSKMTTRTYPPYLLADIGHFPPLPLKQSGNQTDIGDTASQVSLPNIWTGAYLGRGPLRLSPWETNIFCSNI